MVIKYSFLVISPFRAFISSFLLGHSCHPGSKEGENKAFQKIPVWGLFFLVLTSTPSLSGICETSEFIQSNPCNVWTGNQAPGEQREIVQGLPNKSLRQLHWGSWGPLSYSVLFISASFCRGNTGQCPCRCILGEAWQTSRELLSSGLVSEHISKAVRR